MNCSLGLFSDFQPILLQLVVGAKSDAEYLQRSVCSSEGSGKRDSLLRTQPQSQRLVADDLGSCYLLTPVELLADFVNFGVAFHESGNVVGISGITGRVLHPGG